MRNKILYMLCGTAFGYLIAFVTFNQYVAGNQVAQGIAFIEIMYIVLFCAANISNQTQKERQLLGRLMEEAIKLNTYKNVDVYLCLQGNTGCICLTVEKNKSLIYQNRIFLRNKTAICKVEKDIRLMLKYKQMYRDKK